MLITLEEIKNHLRIDPEPDSEQDPQLEMMYEAAIDYCHRFIDTDIPQDSNGLNPSFRAAVLLVIGDLYENREALSTTVEFSPNKTVERLLHFHRKNLGV